MTCTSAVSTVVDTIIVGSGFAGLGMAIRLKRDGRDDFLVLERGHDVGGTWRDNTYPGVACDIPSHLYSFSFRPRSDWSRVFAPGAEIQEYLRACARDEGLVPHLRFDAEVLSMQWSATDSIWRVVTSRGEHRCRILVVAAGRLSEKAVPSIPGLSSFEGSVFHSSEWPSDFDASGLRVGVVGTGASAVQFVPKLAETAAEVVLFQRSAPYVVPRDDREYTPGEREAFAAHPSLRRELREQIFDDFEQGFAARLGVPDAIARLRDTARDHLVGAIPAGPLRDALTPDYEIGCKRVLLSDEFYPALMRSHVTLEPSALALVDGMRVTLADGSAFELDALILATGFLSTRPPFAELVTGRDGVVLSDVWSTGMRAHKSTTIAGFPNLFVLDGPNASLGHNSAVDMIETQISFVLGALDAMRTSAASTLEPTQDAQDAYVDDLDRRAAETVWLTGGCRSWYVDSGSGRLTLLWPDTARAFRAEIGTFEGAGFTLA